MVCLFLTRGVYMSYIVPNSTVKLISNCPLDKSQRDTWYFANIESQYNYFNSIVTQTFTAQSYQRVNKNTIRLEYRADALYSVNYMMFINTNYNHVKWFYAFVDRVEYINDNTCNVHYTIDVIQTWFFEYQEKQCFIQRMSVASDGIGENIEPESFNLPEYVTNGVEVIDLLKPIIVAVKQLAEGDEFLYFENSMIAGEVILVSANTTGGIGALQDYIMSAMIENPDVITDVHMALAPNGNVRYITGVDGSNPNYYVMKGRKMNAGGFEVDYSLVGNLSLDAGSTQLDGYTPRNNKLYTYPYHFINIFTCNGDSLSLRYEYFNNNNRSVHVCGNVLSPASCRLYPKNYKNTSETYYGENLTITGFPSCSWSSDAYTSWLAQNSIPIAVNTGIDIAGLGLSVMTGNPAPMMITSGYSVITNKQSGAKVTTESAQTRYRETPNDFTTQAVQVGLNSLGDAFTQGYKASLVNQITKGSYQNGNISFMKDYCHFYGTRASIPATTARRIDAYFDAFGYAYNNIGTPSRRNRKRYTYIQTRNCLVDGNLPAIDREQIEGIYNEGIRFWVNGVANIGEYNIADNGTL